MKKSSFMKWAGFAAFSFAASLWAAPQGRVALHTWWTAAEFKDLVVTGSDGKVLWQGVPDPAKYEHETDGKWTLVDGVLRQSDPAVTNAVIRFGDKTWDDYTLRVKARKLGGKEGFILHVREKSPGQCIYANYGGWLNIGHGLETRGAYDFVTPHKKNATKIENGRWYDLAVTCRGERVTMSLDGQVIFGDVVMPLGPHTGDLTERERGLPERFERHGDRPLHLAAHRHRKTVLCILLHGDAEVAVVRNAAARLRQHAHALRVLRRKRFREVRRHRGRTDRIPVFKRG